MRARILVQLSAWGETEGEKEQPAKGETKDHDVSGALVGESLARGVAAGKARVVRSVTEALMHMKTGEVLVTDEVRPAFSQVMSRAAALVCRRGSPLSHSAIVAREFRIPAIVIGEAIGRLESGVELVVDGDRGLVRIG